MKRYFALFLILTTFLFFSTETRAQTPEEVMFKTYAGGGGKCYGRSLISYQFDTIEEKLIIRPAYSYMKEIPPVYKTETVRILVEPEHTKIEVTPAVFETVTERVRVKESESYTNISTPIQESDLFVPGEASIELAPAYKRWEKTKRKKNCKSDNPDDCLEWQLVDVPSRVITYAKQERYDKELPATSVVSTSNPEEYMTITKKVLKKEASYKEVKVPAQYTTVTKRVIVEPRKYERIQIPAEYKIVDRIIPIKDGGFMEANEVVCTEDYPRYMRGLQTKLKESGYYNGTVDGRLGKDTQLAIMKFQQDKKLPIGQLDYNTLKLLELVK